MVLGVSACGGSKAEQKADPKPVENTAAAPAPVPDAGPPAPVVPDPCDLFGQNCPDPMVCALNQGKAQCGAAGAVADGQPCAAPTDCAKGLVCTPEGCRAPCDDAHKCAEGSNCTPLKDAAGFSSCVPAPAPVAAPAPAPAADPKKAADDKKGKGKKGKK